MSGQNLKILAIVMIGLTSELKIEKLRHYPYYYLLLRSCML